MRSKSFDSTNTGMLDKIMWNMRMLQIKKYIPNNANIAADFGCGSTAPLLQNLLRKKIIKKAIGIDLDPNFSTHVHSLKLIKANLNNKLPIENNSIDVVFSLATFEHLDNPDLHASEIFRTLKTKGVLIITTPTPIAKPVLELLAYKLKIIDKKEIEDHRQYFNSKILTSLLEKAGFKKEKINSKTFQIGMNNIIVAIK